MKHEAFACEILFGGVVNPAKYGLEYRKGKTVEDVKSAREKALKPKNGMAKTEHEISMLEVYLGGIFKKVKT